MKNVETFNKHKHFVHLKEAVFKCPTCEKSFECKADLKAHFNIHEGKRFTCNICGNTFSNKSNLARHYKKHV